MGKIYIDTVKYLVYADVEIDGLVEKPDVVGAIFGQTEGLLGDELDLRDLQKNGRIGRIEVDLVAKSGKTTGVLKLPSSLDMVETSILAAALETVDRVGPCDAKLKVKKVEDTRSIKRNSLIDRAKGILKNLINEELPESKEISDIVRKEVKSAEISTYGVDKLSSGPNISKYDSIVIVEGRADVLNLLKNDIPNVIALGGAKITPTIIKLCKEKETIVFLDGDRGGDIILNELANVSEIDFVARAPDGKEVEELTRKEIIKSIRVKIPFEQYMAIKNSTKPRNLENHRNMDKKTSFQNSQQNQFRKQNIQQNLKPKRENVLIKKSINQKQEIKEEKTETKPKKIEISKDQEKELMENLKNLENTMRARLFDEKMKMIEEIPVRDIMKKMDTQKGINAIVFDGFITQRLADTASRKNISVLVGLKIGNMSKNPDNVLIFTKK